MTSTTYEVRMSDQIVNTGLDCQRFATREEAEKAAEWVRGQFPDICDRVDAQVVEADGTATITFADWLAA